MWVVVWGSVCVFLRRRCSSICFIQKFRRSRGRKRSWEKFCLKGGVLFEVEVVCLCGRGQGYRFEDQKVGAVCRGRCRVESRFLAMVGMRYMFTEVLRQQEFFEICTGVFQCVGFLVGLVVVGSRSLLGWLCRCGFSFICVGSSRRRRALGR